VNRRKLRVAITGGIATGKSTVLSMLAERGYSVASADRIAADVFADADVQALLAEIASLPLPVDRKALSERIAGEPSIRRRVNRVMHPRILKRLDDTPADFFEVPLLLETCLQGRFDQVWVVSCDPATQLERLKQRTQDEALAKRMIAAQLPMKVKEIFGDEVVRTNCDLTAVQNFVFEVLKRRLEV
jgi:dephospho-CoA kinase